MRTLKQLPVPMLGDIDKFLSFNKQQCIHVYAEAEKIRQRWEEQNIALEDIVSVLVDRCGYHQVAMSFDRRDEAKLLVERDGSEQPSSRFA